MKTFTKEEIDMKRSKYRSEGFKEENGFFGDLEFSYFVIPQELNPNLPDFVMRMTGKNKEDGAIYGIANSVREDFRPYAVAHEAIEFEEIGLDKKGRCAEAVRKELDLVPDKMKGDYIKMRTEFFRNLVLFSSATDGYTKEDVDEFKGSFFQLSNAQFQEFVGRSEAIGQQYLTVLRYLAARDHVLSKLGIESGDGLCIFLREHKNDFSLHDKISQEFLRKVGERSSH